jgi:hypothetical protein
MWDVHTHKDMTLPTFRIKQRNNSWDSFPSTLVMDIAVLSPVKSCHGSCCHLSADICLPSAGNNENVVPSWLFFRVIYYRRSRYGVDREKDRSTGDSCVLRQLFTISLYEWIGRVICESETEISLHVLFSLLLFMVVGVRLSPLGTPATSTIIPAPDDGCRAVSEMWIGKGNRSNRRKPASVPLRLPQMPRDLIETATVECQWLNCLSYDTSRNVSAWTRGIVIARLIFLTTRKHNYIVYKTSLRFMSYREVDRCGWNIFEVYVIPWGWSLCLKHLWGLCHRTVRLIAVSKTSLRFMSSYREVDRYV